VVVVEGVAGVEELLFSDELAAGAELVSAPLVEPRLSVR
jgi:hypothetical protein